MKSIFFVFCSKCAALILAIFLLTGCCSIHCRKASPPYRIITEIDVRYENGALQAKRQFSHPDKLQAIIYYLRTIDPYGTPREDLAEVGGSNFYITLHYSDGSLCQYHQRADRYLRKDDGNWKCIDFRKAQQLSILLEKMPSDFP